MDILNLTTESIERLTPDEAKEGLDRLTPEQRRCLTPAQLAAVIGVLDPRLCATPDERRRRDAAWKLADADTWRSIAASCIESTVQSYALGELEFEEALAFVGRVGIGCWPQARVELLGTTAALAFRVAERRTRRRGVTKKLYPACVKNGAADLIITLKEHQPEKRVTPRVSNREAYDPSSPLIESALEILSVMQWFGRAPKPAPATIDDWVRKRRRGQLPLGEALPTGRPPAKR